MIVTHNHGSYLGVRRVELKRYKINSKLSKRKRERDFNLGFSKKKIDFFI